MEHGQKVGAYGSPQYLPDGVRADHTLYVQAPGHVGGERARPDPGSPADQDHDGLGRLPQDAPLVQPWTTKASFLTSFSLTRARTSSSST